MTNGPVAASSDVEVARILSVYIDDSTLTVDLEDGRTISIPIVWFPRLSYATRKERENWEIAGAGYGIYWPDLDEDIGVEGIVRGRKSGEGPTSFARWLAERKARESVEMAAPQLQLREESASYTTAEAAPNAEPRRLLGFSLTKYIEAALTLAEYERDEDGELIVAIVPGASGFFTQGENFEEARENLRDAIEQVIMTRLQLGWEIPAIPGVQLEETLVHAAA